MENLAEQAQKLGIQIYQPCHEHDAVLLRWWAYLNETEEFDRVFTKQLFPLSKFLDNFQPPRITAFNANDDGIWLCVWIVPFADTDSGAFLNYWCRESKRGTIEHYKSAKFIYDMATKIWPVLIGTTKHEDLLKIHRKLGYNIVGKVPHMIDGEDAWILYLTRELFEQSRFYKIGESHGR